MVAEILATYPEFAGYEIVHNLSSERADEMVKMEAVEFTREWSPHLWHQFNWKTAQIRTGEHRTEIKAVAGQAGQGKDIYYPLTVLITIANGLASTHHSQGEPIALHSSVREEAKEIVSGFIEKTNDELDRYLLPFVVELEEFQ